MVIGTLHGPIPTICFRTFPQLRRILRYANCRSSRASHALFGVRMVLVTKCSGRTQGEFKVEMWQSFVIISLLPLLWKESIGGAVTMSWDRGFPTSNLYDAKLQDIVMDVAEGASLINTVRMGRMPLWSGRGMRVNQSALPYYVPGGFHAVGCVPGDIGSPSCWYGGVGLSLITNKVVSLMIRSGGTEDMLIMRRC
eukprot:g6211.t1 g6211   contig20:1101387-1101974(-)